MESVVADEVDILEDDSCWMSNFTCKFSSYYGYCDNVEQADELIQDYSYLTSSSFIVVRTTKQFGNLSIEDGRIRIICS